MNGTAYVYLLFGKSIILNFYKKVTDVTGTSNLKEKTDKNV